MRIDTLKKMVAEQTRVLLWQQEDLRALGAELDLAERRIRTKKAAELHDHLAQMLALARLHLSQARQIRTQPQQGVECIARPKRYSMNA
jgi:signal transduction histidine kinase